MQWRLSLSAAMFLLCSMLPVAQCGSPAAPDDAGQCVDCDSQLSVFPGQSIQAAVDSAPPGASLVIKTGVHRLQRVTPKDGQAFLGESGAVLSGAQLLTQFVQQGHTWVAGAQTQEGQIHGECQAAYPRCSSSEELFLDDVRLRHVGSVSEVGPGTWFFDYAADRIYLGTDPSGRRVETSVTDAAFTGNASGVTIKGLTIEKYASGAQSGAIYGVLGRAWTVEENLIRLNHGYGLSLGPSMQVRNNRLLANGHLGVGGGDYFADIVVEGNEIAHNNEAGFDPGWEGGGTKFWATINLVARGNWVHHNHGPGLWADFENLGMVYENNVVEDNDWAGIFHEISYAAVIRNNTVRRNGFQDPRGWYWRAGILIAASSDVEIYDNTVEDNANGIVGIQQRPGGRGLGPMAHLEPVGARQSRADARRPDGTRHRHGRHGDLQKSQ